MYSIRKGLVDQAKAAESAAYARHQPQDPDDRYRMELLVTDAYLRAKDYASMKTHAQHMLEASKEFSKTNKTEFSRRDEMLLKSGFLLADAYMKTNQKAEAIQTLEDLRRLSIELPSGNLYKLVTFRLFMLDPRLDVAKIFEDRSASAKSLLPEIVASQWLEQTPVTFRPARQGRAARLLGTLVRALPGDTAKPHALA